LAVLPSVATSLIAVLTSAVVVATVEMVGCLGVTVKHSPELESLFAGTPTSESPEKSPRQQ
jgi:hypothetical protein